MKRFLLFSVLFFLLTGCKTGAEKPEGLPPVHRDASLQRSFTLSGTEWVPDPSDRVFSDPAFAVPENALLTFQKGTYTGQAGRNRFYGQYEEKGRGCCRFSKGSAAMAKSSEPVRRFVGHWMECIASADRYVPEKTTLLLYRDTRLLIKLKRKP